MKLSGNPDGIIALRKLVTACNQEDLKNPQCTALRRNRLSSWIDSLEDEERATILLKLTENPGYISVLKNLVCHCNQDDLNNPQCTALRRNRLSSWIDTLTPEQRATILFKLTENPDGIIALRKLVTACNQEDLNNPQRKDLRLSRFENWTEHLSIRLRKRIDIIFESTT